MQNCFKIKHHAGYKGIFIYIFISGELASGAYKYFKMLIIILFIIESYFILGYFYNQKYTGLEGFEALSHSNFWKDFP